MKKNFLWSATFLALSTAGISGFSNFLNKFAVSASFDPVVYTVVKNGLVALALAGILLAIGKWREIAGLNKKQWLKLLAVGLLGGGLPFALFFLGLSQTSALNAALIHKTLVIWVALLAAAFLKERLTRPLALGVLAVFLGNLIIGGFSGFAFSAGELMILAATLLWAAESIIAKKVLAETSSTVVACARMVFGLLVLVPISLMRGASPHVFVQMSPTAWGWTLAATVLLLVYVLTWYEALKRAPAIYVAALLTPATLVTNVLSAVFITHSFNWRLLASAGLFAIGIFLLIKFIPNFAAPPPILERASKA